MKRIQEKLKENKKLLSIYMTAGYPELDDTVPIIKELEKNGVDMIEIGIPFSDPLADGPTIQESSTQALKNGMTLKLLLEQLQDIRKEVSIPLVLMGYFNPILQYGVEKFCDRCQEIGIDGIIIPDLPLEIYSKTYQPLFEKYNLSNILLITPQTSEKRIREIDNLTNTFIYMVSSASTTGSQSGFGTSQTAYFQKIHQMHLKNPQIVGFGIYNQQTYNSATQYAKGAIIGSAFIKFLSHNPLHQINQFIKEF
ncbi:MAG: tryptophan synthase subunit alpha [Alteromonas sp.]|nr:tryptophan synthase subunit alpha [Alteromonas sp.]MAY21524.1 tryptophan synthase subunit alpha [Flavobacteriaceae bacterium]|tara:strand:+ start:66655 stop:67413 length:759 start_codon:yes stop_codon:yes gene_type:complete